MVASPHYLATLAGLRTLEAGGGAVDAAIAVNATLGVVYPHMTGIGGDAFWLIYAAGTGQVHALNGSGRAAGRATRDRYLARGRGSLPSRGPLSCVTVPGAVASWCAAHDRFGKLHLEDLLRQAVDYARDGYPVSAGQVRFTAAAQDVLIQDDRARRAFMPNGRVPLAGELMRFPRLADTLEAVAHGGRTAFYDGRIAEEIGRAVTEAGGHLDHDDLRRHESTWDDPITTTYRGRTLYQAPPNGQGFAHLMIMNVLENFDVAALDPDGAEYVHLVVEASKLAFADRDRYLTDPEFSDIPVARLLSKEHAGRLAARIDLRTARRTAPQLIGADTTCTVVVDRWGNAVSMIQSLYHEFGSAFIAGDTGVLLQNRGSHFSLDHTHVNRLEPGKRCFHTLMPGMAFRGADLDLVYGTMGGEGQPQTCTALATRHIDFDHCPQIAIDRPRWLYGRVWGEATRNLHLEARFGDPVARQLERLGHEVEVVDGWSDLAGHAAAISIDHHNKVLVGAADPRGEGIAAGW